jgi:hypothetical protein
VIERIIQQRLRQPVFANIWKATGLPGAPPPVFVGGLGNPRVLGEQPWYNRSVHLDPRVVNDLRAYGVPGAIRNPQALEVLLHEYAHVPQPRVGTTPFREGGAEAWAQHNLARVMAALHDPIAPQQPPVAYAPWTRRIGPVARDYGQFGRRP